MFCLADSVFSRAKITPACLGERSGLHSLDHHVHIGLLQLVAVQQTSLAEERHQDDPGAEVLGGVDALLEPGRAARIAGQRVPVQQSHHER